MSRLPMYTIQDINLTIPCNYTLRYISVLILFAKTKRKPDHSPSERLFSVRSITSWGFSSGHSYSNLINWILFITTAAMQEENKTREKTQWLVWTTILTRSYLTVLLLPLSSSQPASIFQLRSESDHMPIIEKGSVPSGCLRSHNIGTIVIINMQGF